MRRLLQLAPDYSTSTRYTHSQELHSLRLLFVNAAGTKFCGFNQVLRLLEDVGLPELVIQLASLAVTEAVNDVNSQVTTFLYGTSLHSDGLLCKRDLNMLLSSGCSVDSNIQTSPGPWTQR